jgi:Major capsid protein Gp23.
MSVNKTNDKTKDLFECYNGNIQNSFGGSNRPDPKALVNKWQKEINEMKQSNPNMGFDRLWLTANMLENVDRHLAKMTRLINEGAITNPAHVSYFKRYGFEMMTKVISNFVIPEIASVQPMLSRAGNIYFMEACYGSDKAPVNAGETMFSALKAGDFSQHTYTSDIIDGETYVANPVVLKWLPAIPRTVNYAIYDANGVIVDGSQAHDNGNGQLLRLNDGTQVGTVDYVTGVVALVTAPTAAAQVKFTYTYDNISAPVNAPEMFFRIVPKFVEAKSRKLVTRYSLDAAYDLENDYDFVIDAESAVHAASQIQNELDLSVINDMFAQASAPGGVFNMHRPVGVNLMDHYASFVAEITKMINGIYNGTGMKLPGNFIIAGENASNVIETLDDKYFVRSGQTTVYGSYVSGTFKGLPVIKTPESRTNFLVGHKGESLFHAGYIYAPYMPIMSTQLLMDENFEGRRGYATANAQTMINSALYAKGIIVDQPEIIQTWQSPNP